MVVIGRGFGHALKNVVADLLNADHVVHLLARATTQNQGGVLDVRTIGLLDLAVDIPDRHRPRPKGIGVQDKRYKQFHFDAG